MAGELKIEYNEDKTKIWCNIRKKFVAVRKEGLEEEVRQNTIIDIVTRYKYDISFIDVEVPIKIRQEEVPRRADIIIYKNNKKFIPFIVIENKRPEVGKGADQAEKYTRIIGAEYCKFTNGIVEDSRRLAYISGQAPQTLSISDIPHFGKEVKYLITEILPFIDIKNVLEYCHKDLRNIGKDPVESFKIMSKIIISKIFDERNTPFDKPYQLQKGVNESDNEVGERVRKLYKIAIKSLSSRNGNEPINDDNIEIGNDTITLIVQKIQRYSFLKTSTDIKGTVFETFIDAAFRGPFGQYFTPREIVNFMVEMINPNENDVVIDPACGSGGFLIYILSHIKKSLKNKYKNRLNPDEINRKVFEFAQDNLFGIDIAQLPIFAAKVNMLINEDGRANIYKKNAMIPLDELPLRIKERINKFSLAITNPPFGILEKNPRYLAGFETAKDENNRLKNSKDTKILYIERCLQLIKPHGKVMIVLPNGILNNPSNEYREVRNFILKNSILKAVIRLRDDAFLHTGTGSRTSLVLLQKKSRNDLQGNIFMSWVNKIGYDKKGNNLTKSGKHIENDLPNVFMKYEEWERTGHFAQIDEPLTFLVAPEDLTNSLDPRFYNPHLTSKLKELKKRLEFFKLKELLVDINSDMKEEQDDDIEAFEENLKDTSKIIKGNVPRIYINSGIKIIMISQIKEVNNLYMIDYRKTNCISVEFHENSIASKLYPDEIILAVTGATIGKVAIVPKDIGEANICNDIVKIRVDKNKIDPYYVFAYLSSELGQMQIRSRISGSTNEHLSPLAIEDLDIPIPSEDKWKNIAKLYKEGLDHLYIVDKNCSKGRNELQNIIGKLLN